MDRRHLVSALILGLGLAGLVGGCQPRGKTEDPIFTAVRNNDKNAVKTFLAGGGDPNMSNRDGDPLLYVASGPKGGIAVASVLIAAGADVNKPAATGRTPLVNAVSWCDVQMVTLLLAAGANKGKLADPVEAGKIACRQPVANRQQTLMLLQ